jgi:hypothetical protein
MELYWKINGTEFGIRDLGYSWAVIKKVDANEDPFYLEVAAYNFAWTLRGAKFSAWSFARRWASFDGCDELLFVFENKPSLPPWEGKLVWEKILKVKVVPVFWPVKPKQ